MLTPQEISERTFVKVSFGGYNMAMVDEFLDELTADYSALYKENAVLKNKMKVLVDKVEEYRSTEDAMRQTLLVAQKNAQSMVKEAEEQRDHMLSEAEAEARAKIGHLREEFDQEQFRLDAARRKTAEVVAQMREVLAQQNAYLDRLTELAPPPQSSQDHVQETVQEIDRAFADMAQQPKLEDAVTEDTQEIPSSTREDEYDDVTAPTRRLSDANAKQLLTKLRSGEEILPTDFGEEEAEVTGRINFDNLEFGENFTLE